jgi:TatD DNase family protein
MNWIDSHIHLSSFTEDEIKALLEKSSSQNIKRWVMAGYDSLDWHRQLKLKNLQTSTSFGLHPWQVLKMTDEEIGSEMQTLQELLPQADFLGETGIDGFRAKTSEELQKQEQVFIQHLELNKSFNKPLVLHIVKSHERAISLLKAYSYRGLIHGFSGSWEVAKLYIDLGYKISIGRGVYQKGYKALKDVVAHISLDDLLIESDAFNDPESDAEDAVSIYLQVVEAVCQIKNISQQELQEATFHNINSL